jgi:hypothetical protein
LLPNTRTHTDARKSSARGWCGTLAVIEESAVIAFARTHAVALWPEFVVVALLVMALSVASYFGLIVTEESWGWMMLFGSLPCGGEKMKPYDLVTSFAAAANRSDPVAAARAAGPLEQASPHQTTSLKRRTIRAPCRRYQSDG